ncbi:MAG: class I SAM-dependent methyltransferase [Flavobacteriaceae bacterium]
MTEKSSCDINDKNSSCCSVKNDDSVDFGEHWCGVYTDSDISKLGWYEDESTPVLELIDACNLNKDAKILTVGAGATTLIDSLINLNYTNLIANDISSCALNALKRRLGEAHKNITWIVDDITNPNDLKKLTDISLWIDRAVLHFFTEDKDQDTYFDLLKSSVAKEGYVILAEFNLSGATKCSGLDVKRYNAKILSSKLGSDFVLQKEFDYIYTMPNGDTRNYVYTLFKRLS